jgi:predicted enzyme related to lactoylglutathione lyase
MELKHNMIGWFEIPVENMDRAIKFYENVFEIKLQREKMGPLDMAWFPWVENSIGAGGSLVYDPENYKPSSDGVLIYFTTATGDIDEDLKRVEANGGQAILPKTLISEEIGYMGIFIDSEGNKLALHAH